MWHWRAEWDLSGVIWSPVVGGGCNYLGTESQQREHIWLVNYPWNSREVRGWTGWQSPLSLLAGVQFQSTLTSCFSSGGGCGCLGCGYQAGTLIPQRWLVQAARSPGAKPSFSTTFLCDLEESQFCLWAPAFFFEKEKFIQDDAGNGLPAPTLPDY